MNNASRGRTAPGLGPAPQADPRRAPTQLQKRGFPDFPPYAAWAKGLVEARHKAPHAAGPVAQARMANRAVNALPMAAPPVYRPNRPPAPALFQANGSPLPPAMGTPAVRGRQAAVPRGVAGPAAFQPAAARKAVPANLRLAPGSPALGFRQSGLPNRGRPVMEFGKGLVQPKMPAFPAGALPRRGVIQRADEIRARYEQFEQKRESVYSTYDFDYGQPEIVNDKVQYGGQASLDEIASGAFSGLGSRSTGAVGMLQGTLLFASQTGSGSAAVSKTQVQGYNCVAADVSIPNKNMHAEMIIVYYCLKNSIDPKTIKAIGVKDKGCCRICSAMLQHLGIAFTRTEDSSYEVQWVDPYEAAGLQSPLGKGSGVSSLERNLL